MQYFSTLSLIITLLPAWSNADPVDPSKFCPDNVTAETWNFPYPGDCTRWVKCDPGNINEGIPALAAVYRCEEPLYFNPDIQTCDWTKPATCLVTDTPEASDDENESGWPGDVKDCPAINPDPLVPSYHVPYPGDCAKFIKCAYNEVTLAPVVATIYTCDSPLVFNPIVQTCDWAHNVDCSN